MKNTRRYFPGGEWLYIKIYTSEMTANNIINLIYHKIIIKNTGILSWFFIRFYDPDFHIRIRFLLYDKNEINNILNEMNRKLNRLIYCKTISRIQLDTYDREIERYGDKTIESAEMLFHYDSILFVNNFLVLQNCANKNFQWMASIMWINSYFDLFELPLTDKISFTEQISLMYEKEFNVNRISKNSINKIYREKKVLVNCALSEKFDDNDWDNIVKNTRNIRKILKGNNLCKKIKFSSSSTQTFMNTLSSIIHMHVNRHFIDKNRIHELIIYEFLFKSYKSLYFRDKYSV